MHWQADSIKAVLFTAPFGSHRDASELWAEAFPGDTPDGYQRNPSAPNLQSSASGERYGFVINVTAQVGQISVVATPVFRQVPGLVMPGLTPPRIAEVTDATYIAVEAMKRLAPSFQAARIALILELAKTAVGVVTADMMSEELPNVPFPPGSIEPSFQFNSLAPLPSAPHITLNRICIWSSGQVGFFGGNMPGVPANGPMAMSSFIGFNVDVNTSPSQNLFGVNLTDAFDCLRSEALSIAENQMRHFL
ncbi:hypothetical protein [Sphingomonas sp. OK281]|uniref:hypothetical protein n=1 Tax=Sphingomonas sp. OK281 TaxID=1881067 RepID=UPI0008F1AEA1|nr:hypothetical protein [Sphingomonas sp. OK281]SFO18881.1 hypothetical protein SAMN05428984_2620 [Sphingomonas sp. OK281]